MTLCIYIYIYIYIYICHDPRRVPVGAQVQRQGRARAQLAVAQVRDLHLFKANDKYKY